MGEFRRVLVANRGEVAVRVMRAVRDAGLCSVAVYADPDGDAPHVRLADEAFALDGSTAAQTYLASAKLLDVAARSVRMQYIRARGSFRRTPISRRR